MEWGTMENTKHTPGEWTQEYDGSVCMAGQVVIPVDFLAPDGCDINARRANGKLIAAAPKMANALDLILSYATKDYRSRNLEHTLQMIAEIAQDVWLK